MYFTNLSNYWYASEKEQRWSDSPCPDFITLTAPVFTGLYLTLVLW